MSKITLEPNNSGTGTFTIAAPNSNTNRTLNLPDEAGTALTDATDLEPQVKTSLNATGDAPMFACRAWVNFDGSGTVSIRDSGNVSSITDRGIGEYTVNFTTAMPNSNYAFAGKTIFSFGNDSFLRDWIAMGTPSVSSLEIRHNRTDTTTDEDSDVLCVTIFV